MLRLAACAVAPRVRAAQQPVFGRAARSLLRPRACPLSTRAQDGPEIVEARDKALRADGEVDDEALRKRLIYRSKQRGWLEVDLLMGKWAAEHVPDLDSAGLTMYEAILNCETLDIYNLLIGRLELVEVGEARGNPEELIFAQPVLDKLRKFCLTNPIGKADPAAYANLKGVMSN